MFATTGSGDHTSLHVASSMGHTDIIRTMFSDGSVNESRFKERIAAAQSWADRYVQFYPDILDTSVMTTKAVASADFIPALAHTGSISGTYG